MKIRLGCALAMVLSVLVAVAPAEAQKKTLVIGTEPGSGHPGPDALPDVRRAASSTPTCARSSTSSTRTSRSRPSSRRICPAFADGGKTVTIKLRSGVKFNDGTPLNAEAMKFSLDRHREMKGSSRRSELDHVNAVEVVDPLTVRLRLKAPFSPITAILADRAGMPVSPTAGQEARRQVRDRARVRRALGVRRARRQDRIVLDKSPHYFDPGQAKFDRLVFRIITDDNVRLANLRSGDIDFMHQVSPTHARSLKKEAKLRRRQRDGHRLHGDHHQPPQQERQASCGPRRPGHPARQRSPRPRGAGALDRPRGDEPGGLGRPVHGRLHAHLAGEPVPRQEPQVPGPGRRARQEAPRRRGPRAEATASSSRSRTSPRSAAWAR